MYTYARHFGCSHSVLIYPATSEFRQPSVFRLEGVSLVAVPYDVVEDRFLLGNDELARGFLGTRLFEILSKNHTN